MGSLKDDAQDSQAALNPAQQVKWLADLLDRQGIDVRDVGTVRRINTYQTVTKDADGETTKHDLIALSFAPSWDQGPEFPVVQRAPQSLDVPVKKPGKRDLAKTRRTAVIFPDQQIGYRKFDDGTLDPFHSEEAIACAFEILEYLEANGGVDQVGNLGDVLDLAPMSRHPQEPTFHGTVQPQIDYGHAHLAQQRKTCPKARIWMLEGNHDRRIQNSITLNAMHAVGLRRGGTPPDSWPVLSIPYLLRLDELGIEYIAGFPAGEVWIAEDLVAFHGRHVKSSGSSAAATVYSETVSSIFGHVHRVELQYRTVRDRAGAKQIFGASPGCLARTDGAVPSTKGSTDPLGRAVPVSENWQNGIAVVTYTDTGVEGIELVHIESGRAVFRGQEFGAAR